MHSFRENTPKHRLNRDECKNYTSYHDTLCEDFNRRCGYCDDYDKLRIRSFTIDHFVPQNPKDLKHDIKPNYYYNLVYSCRYCNAAKTNKWPTKDVTKFNDGSVGFIFPTTDEYTDLFRRNKFGKIIPYDVHNPLAQHIIDELKLWIPIHQQMWKLERIKLLSSQIKAAIVTISDNEIKKALEAVHYEILVTMEELYDGIFVENE